jgi:hypothetical protein
MRINKKQQYVVQWGWIMLLIFLVAVGCKIIPTAEDDYPPVEGPVMLVVNDITQIPTCTFDVYIEVNQGGAPIVAKLTITSWGTGWVELTSSGGVDLTQDVEIILTITYASLTCPFKTGDKFSFKGKMMQKGSVFRVSFTSFKKM